MFVVNSHVSTPTATAELVSPTMGCTYPAAAGMGRG